MNNSPKQTGKPKTASGKQLPLVHADPENQNESKSFYANQVRAILRSVKGRHGFIEWNRVGFVGKAANNMLVMAKQQLYLKHYQTTMYICCAVLEEMTKALQFADDSNGDIGGNIREAMGLLTETASEILPEKSRKWLFDYTLSAFSKGLFEGWDWHTEMLSLASMIFRGEKEANRIMVLLDQPTDSEYERQEAQAIKLGLLADIGDETAVMAFINENISTPSIRKIAMEKALEKNDVEKAIAIAQEGIRFDQDERPGLVHEWTHWLMKIALKQKYGEKIIEYARQLFIDSIREKEGYYGILKSHVAPDQWNLFVETMVSDIVKKGRWRDTDILAWIFIREEWWERLLELVSRSGSLEAVHHFEQYLADRFPEQIADLYAQGILHLMEHHTGRYYYRDVCRYLRRMKKLGAGEQVGLLMEQLQKTYPQRKALLEELEKV